MRVTSVRARAMVAFGAVLASAGLWGLAWLRFADRLAQQPAPARSIRFQVHGGALAWSPPSCREPAFVDEHEVWLVCETELARARWLARFIPERGVADLWPAPPISGPFNIVAAGRRAPSSLTVVLFDGDVLHVEATGVKVLGRVAAHGKACGLAWIEDALEVVSCGGVPERVHRWSGGTWSTRPVPAGPAFDPSVFDQRLEVAVRNGAGWTYDWFRYPRQVRSGTPAHVQVFRVADSGQTLSSDELDLPLDDGGRGVPVDWPMTVGVDGSAGGRVLWATADPRRLIEQREGHWQPLRLPGEVARVPALEADYRLLPNRLALIPRWGDVTRRHVRIGDRIITVDVTGGSVVVRASAGADRSITVSPAFDGNAHVAPGPNGSVWLLGSSGDYVQLTDQLSRADSPNGVERLGLFDRHFGDFVQWLALAVCLLLLPALWLLAAPALFVPRMRATRHTVIVGVSIGYVVAALALFTTFWQTTALL